MNNGNDRWVWLGVGVAIVAVASVVRTRLQHYRDAAIIPPQAETTKQIDQDVEDAIKPSTLDKLLYSTSYAVREVASMIVLERAIHSRVTITSLRELLRCARYRERELAIRALTTSINSCKLDSPKSDFLPADSSSATIEHINQPETYAALVKCLEYCVTDYDHNPFEPHWDNWSHRDYVERGCLHILELLVARYGVDELVKTSFIESWLVKEPWGDNPKTKFLAVLSKYEGLSSIARSLFLNTAARKQLKAHHLLSHHFSDRAHGAANDIRMVGGESTAGEIIDEMDAEIRPTRRRAISLLEDDFRRRNREAMVFNDGTRPFERSDIIERD